MQEMAQNKESSITKKPMERVMELKFSAIYNHFRTKRLKSSTFHQIYLRLLEKQFYSEKGIQQREIMTEENFFDMFNRIHNPDYYYGRQKTQKKKTEKKKKTRRTNTIKRYPVFKVQD